MQPARLSRELRLGTSPDLTRRRWVVGLNLACAAIGGVVGAYQIGMLRHLPDPPVGPFDSDRVDASNYGYKRLDVPDGFLMTLTYAGSAALAAMGGEDRAEEQPHLPIATSAKAVYDLATAAKLAQEEWSENRALCAWCQAATALTAVAAALTLPETARAARSLARQAGG
ncbi:vitamin K epoxide reductase family protein [Hasllibacter halocynthiae]|uniref:Vitamin K epoxide reductase family protein n=1 Tax=Hasllibacter halocynthiae TaxID=595589 RepID=A0A2T0X111_9RHOB|nr:vitamin K epoxide reductase family protein [Hasllibacter halocynthiae]PRY92636.1 vitamin K epoxide reductase family protein [Hasllibacter halocynthiae]